MAFYSKEQRNKYNSLRREGYSSGEAMGMIKIKAPKMDSNKNIDKGYTKKDILRAEKNRGFRRELFEAKPEARSEYQTYKAKKVTKKFRKALKEDKKDKRVSIKKLTFW